MRFRCALCSNLSGLSPIVLRSYYHSKFRQLIVAPNRVSRGGSKNSSRCSKNFKCQNGNRSVVHALRAGRQSITIAWNRR
jgi:hypothetical protein